MRSRGRSRARPARAHAAPLRRGRAASAASRMALVGVDSAAQLPLALVGPVVQVFVPRSWTYREVRRRRPPGFRTPVIGPLVDDPVDGAFPHDEIHTARVRCRPCAVLSTCAQRLDRHIRCPNRHPPRGVRGRLGSRADHRTSGRLPRPLPSARFPLLVCGDNDLVQGGELGNSRQPSRETRRRNSSVSCGARKSAVEAHCATFT